MAPGSRRLTIGALSAKSKPIEDVELLEYYVECWRWNSDGELTMSLAPTKNVFDSYNKITGKRINTFSYQKRGWRWSELKLLMHGFVSRELSLEDVISGKIAKIDNPVSPRIRALVIERDGRRCLRCGASPLIHDSVVLHVHHIVPRSKGGSSTDLENLETLCAMCNQGQGNLELG